MKRKNEIKDFVWNAVGLSFNAFNSLFFLIVVKLVNGIDEAGIFTYAFSLCCLFYIVALFFNRTYQVSDNKQDFCFRDYLAFRGISAVLSLLAIFLFSIISGFAWDKIFVILLLMIFRIVEAISDCFYGEMQKNDKLYKTGISLTLKAVIGFVCFLIIDIICHNLYLAIGGLILTNVVIFTTFDMAQVRDSLEEKVSISRDNVRNMFRATWPVFVFSILSVFLANCQKYVLTYFADNEIQAIFGILIMPATVISLVGSYFVNPFVGKLTELNNKKKYAEFQKCSLKIVGMVLGIGMLALAVCSIIGIPILNFVYQMELGEYWSLLDIVILAATISSVGMVLSGVLTVMGKNKVQSIIYIIVSIIVLSASIALISGSGIEGAVYAYLLSGVLITGGYMIIFFREMRRLR